MVDSARDGESGDLSDDTGECSSALLRNADDGNSCHFNGDSKPDFVLYKPSTRQTALWYSEQQRLCRRRIRFDSSNWLEVSWGGGF